MAFTFTLEDGTSIAGANAYVAVATVDDYFAGTGGNTTWTNSGTTQKQDAIVAATRYVEQRFSTRWKGTKADEDQGLSWPRDAAFVDGFELDDQVPVVLENAVAEYAVRARTAALLLDAQATTGNIVEESVVVGPIERSQRFSETGGRSPQHFAVSDIKIPEYPAADLWLEPILRPTGRTSR